MGLDVSGGGGIVTHAGEVAKAKRVGLGDEPK
jgi:hypothetical protein